MIIRFCSKALRKGLGVDLLIESPEVPRFRYNAALLRIDIMRLVEKALTFDDVLLLPAHSVVLPRNVNLATRLTRASLSTYRWFRPPWIRSPKPALAIALAQEGGIGIIHKNMPVESQAAHVANVKRFESGVVKDPITIPPDMTVRDVLNLIRKYKISGLPVVEGVKSRRYRHQSGSSFRNQSGSAHQEYHDAERPAGYRK